MRHGFAPDHGIQVQAHPDLEEEDGSMDSFLREAGRIPPRAQRGPEPLQVGEPFGHFTILQKLGEGGMGVVYAAEDHSAGRRVALKVLRADRVGESERRLRFLREGRAASAISHPSIASVLEVGEHRGTVFLSMEHVNGKTLRAMLRGRGGPLDLAVAAGIASDLAAGLSEAHRAGIVHRDLKPENVMIDSRGLAKILDFGLAKRLDADKLYARGGPVLEFSTAEGKIVGTPSYMAPEQAAGMAVDGRTDLFSLGVILYEMVTGQRPFRADSAMAIVLSVAHDRPEPASRLNPNVPPLLDDIIHRCLAKLPRDRFPSCSALCAALGQLQLAGV